MDALYKDTNGYTELEASSLAVGLPEGLMGNSEVGHLNIGAGRVVWQDVVRIDQIIKQGEFSSNEVIKKTFQGAAAGNGRLHLCGLVSHGGVVSFSYAPLHLLRIPLPIPRPTLSRLRIQPQHSLTPPTALQANPPLRSPQGRQGVWCPQGLHPLLW